MDAKRKIVVVATLLIVATILVAAFVIYRVEKPDMIAYEAQTRGLFEDAKNQFESIRNVTLPSDIQLIIYTKAQATERWGKGYADANLESIHRMENLYKGLFMMTEDQSLYEAAVEWTASWIAATVGNEIYVIYENFDPWNMPKAEATLIHELTHVWEPDLVNPTNFDTDKAHAALVEGDSSYMSTYFKTQYANYGHPQYTYSNSWSLFLIDFYSSNNIQLSMPESVSKLNWFPYTKGELFVTSIVTNGGWAKLNLCYESAYTPSTTEQILHLEKYFANETSIPTKSPIIADDSWTLIQTSRGYNSDTYGEYFIQIMLSNWLKNSNEQTAIDAASGWGGDNFTYYEKGNDFLFAWNITWDNIQDASEFNQAFMSMLNLAGAEHQGSSIWLTNGRFLTLRWDQNTASTFIACSTDQTAVQSSFFT